MKIAPGYQYLNDGFVLSSQDNWSHLSPIDNNKTPQTDFKMEILVHKPKTGGIGAQGHASIRLSTPSGEVYSVGFFPKDDNSSPSVRRTNSLLGNISNELGIKEGVILSPDPFMFLPPQLIKLKKLPLN